MKLKQNAVDLTDLAIGILILGIVVSIGSTILISMRDSRLTDLSTVTTTKEALTISGNTDTLANTWGKSVISVQNVTTGATVNSGNYTYSVNAADGTITITNLTSTLQPWDVNYTWYNTSRSDWSVANNASNGLGEYGNWFKIIVIVGVAAVILGLIFVAFGRGSTGQTEGSVSY
jgi:hypothetical protein